MANLYGDGVHSDFQAIQEMLNTRREVRLPEPEVCYLIDGTLKIPSGRRLVLPRWTVIRLADGVNGKMITNADAENGNQDIEIRGGIWDQNNKGQAPNPIHYPSPELPEYDGIGFFFRNVRNLTCSDLTLKDPVTFASAFDTVRNFTIENITFDFNYGNPQAINMDGVHLNGNCHYGVIRNLKGACYDDLVALNADEGSDGPISNIVIDGIFAEDCHSAVRLLTVKNRVEHIHITNVFGTYYQYCIGVTKYYPGETTGFYEALVFDNIHASKAPRHTVYCKDGTYEFPLIWIQENEKIGSLAIRHLYRREKTTPVPTVYIGENTKIRRLLLDDIVTENLLDTPIRDLEILGEIEYRDIRNIQ